MFAKPQSEHRWLDQLLGSWDFVHRCHMPDGSEPETPGKMVCRSVGGMWLIGESSGQTPDGETWTSIMTIGYDPSLNQYVGTFIGSMMANIWPYLGVLDPSGNRLPLYTEGPSLNGSGMGKYRDTIEIVDADTWMFFSELLGDDGQWQRFLVGKHTRATH